MDFNDLLMNNVNGYPTQEDNPMGQQRSTQGEQMDYRKFIDTLYVLLITLWGEDWGRFTMKRPNVNEGVKNADLPAITYVLKELKPGEIGQSGTIERKPRQRESYINEDGQSIRVDGQIMDARIEFAVYGESNKEALELSEAFREVMNTYKGYFMHHGLHNLWFVREFERQGNEQRRDDMATRGLEYLVRLEELNSLNKGKFEQIMIEADTYYYKLYAECRLPSQSTE